MYEELVKSLRVCGDALEKAAFAEYETCLYKQAADAIEKLQAGEKKFLRNISALEMENENLKRARRWIPVTERLPLYGQDVLAVRTYGDGEKCQEVLMAHIAVWDEETGKKWWNATNITHWMPLPEPPKEE